MMLRTIPLTAVLAFAAHAASTSPAKLVSIHVEPDARTLTGSGASQQLLVIGAFSDGFEKDVTDQAAWQLSDPSLARIAPTARLLAQADGKLTVTATLQGRTAKSAVVTFGTGDAVRDFLARR